MMRVLRKTGEIRLAPVFLSHATKEKSRYTNSLERTLKRLRMHGAKIRKIRLPRFDLYAWTPDRRSTDKIIDKAYLVIIRKAKQ